MEELQEFELACTDVLERLSESEPNGSWIVGRYRADGSVVVLYSSAGSRVGPGMALSGIEPAKGYGYHEQPDLLVHRGASTAEYQPSHFVSAPIQVGEQPFGLLAGLLGHTFGDHLDDRLAVELMAGLVGRVLATELEMVEEQRLRAQATEDALTDPLTRIGNRRAWELSIDREEQRCKRYGHEASVLVLDMDGLKKINDEEGHAAGDALITRTVDVLTEVVRDVDTVARLGGDEFGVLLPETDLVGSEHFRERLDDALRAQGLSASIGLDQRHPAVGLMGAWYTADADMYRRKHDPSRVRT